MRGDGLKGSESYFSSTFAPDSSSFFFTSFCYIKNIIYVLKIYKKITAGIFPDTSAVNSKTNFHYQLGLFILLATNSRRISRHIFVSRPIFLFALLCLVLFLSQAWKPRKSAICGRKKPPSPRLAMSAKTAISKCAIRGSNPGHPD